MYVYIFLFQDAMKTWRALQNPYLGITDVSLLPIPALKTSKLPADADVAFSSIPIPAEPSLIPAEPSLIPAEPSLIPGDDQMVVCHFSEIGGSTDVIEYLSTGDVIELTDDVIEYQRALYTKKKNGWYPHPNTRAGLRR